MGVLIAILGQGKGTWTHVKRIVELGEYESIFIITNDFGIEKYVPIKGETMIRVDFNENTTIIRDQIISQLKGPLQDVMETEINITSGSGKEHSALISAVLKLGVGVRLIDLIDDKVVEL